VPIDTNIIATAREICDYPPQYFLTLPNQDQGFKAFSSSVAERHEIRPMNGMRAEL
jgi:predicted YcjX-like family ATPase